MTETENLILYFHEDFKNIPMYSKKQVLELLKEREEKLRNMALVLMHKKTGDLYEYFWGGFFKEVIAWEDTTVEPLCHEIINSASPMMFNDDPRWNLNDYELLGAL